MAKLTTDQTLRILDAAQEEQVQNSDFRVFHPYEGLEDERGSLTRYSKENKDLESLLPTKWVVEFLNAGGKSFDSAEAWGPSPYQNSYNKVNELSPTTVALMQIAFGRVDQYAEEPNVNILEEYGWIHNPDISSQDAKAAIRGSRRKAMLRNVGVDCKKSLFTLGHMNAKVFARFYFTNTDPLNHDLSRVWIEDSRYCHHEDRYIEERTLYLADVGVYIAINELPKKWEFVLECRSKEVKRLALKDAVNKKPISPSRRLFIKALKKYGSWERSSFYQNRSSFLNIAWVDVDYSRTTEGVISYFPEYKDLITLNNVWVSTRKVGEYYVAKINSTCFAWRQVEDFNDHREGSTVKKAIEALERASNKGGLVFSLDYIQQETYFCFAGVKNFLKKEMTHVYHLVASFNSWDEVPTELKEIEWSLASRSIFSGYPAP